MGEAESFHGHDGGHKAVIATMLMLGIFINFLCILQCL